MSSVPHNGTETSRLAAESMEPHVTKQEAIIYAAIKSAGARGLTSDEAEGALDKRHQSVSARFNGLVKKGLLEPVEKRKTRSGRLAQAWRVKALN